MLDLVPAEVADVNETLYAILKLGKHAEVGDVAYGSLVLAANRILGADVLPRILGKLLETKGNLVSIAVDAEDACLNFVTYLEELLSAVQTWAPRHFGNVNESFYARFNLDECAVVSDEDNLTLNGVAFLEGWIEGIPRPRSELLETESDTLLLLVEVENDNLDLLIEGNDLLRVIYTTP